MAPTLFLLLALLTPAHAADLANDPMLRCRLKTLLGDAHLKKLDAAMPQVETRDRDANGTVALVGSVPGLGGVAGAYVASHPDGRLWVAYLDEKEVPYFTNDPEAPKPPAAIIEWAGADAKFAPVAAPKDFAARVAKACASVKARDNGVCDAKAPFEAAAVVLEKTSIGSGKSYLVGDDVVRVTKATGDTVCAAYRRTGAKEAYGNVSTKALSVLSPTNPLLAKREAAAKAPHAVWAGEWWNGDAANLTVLAPEGQGLVVSGNAQNGANVGAIEKQAFTVAGAKAVTTREQLKGGEVCEGLTLYRFNNALFVTEEKPCGGVGASFQGAYFKNTDRRSRKH